MLRPLSALVCLFLVALGAWSMVNALARTTTEERATYPGLRSVEVEDAGHVRVTGVPAGSAVRVVAQITHSLTSPEQRVDHAGGRLVIDSSCPVVLAQECEIDYEIAVPPDVRVVVDARGADVEAADLRTDEPLLLHSSAGDVSAERVVAPELDAGSSAGDVRLLEIGSPRIEARSSAGDVRVDALSPLTRLAARSSAGDVDVVVPEGVYALTATAGAGDVRAGAIRTDPDSRRSLELRSSAGDVTAEVQTRR
jgi:hypothetical protein